jgi:branched-chain amino acid aminotransferase
VNSILAAREARRSGYDEALMLDTDGFVSEASGENIFIIRDDVVKTPPLTPCCRDHARHHHDLAPRARVHARRGALHARRGLHRRRGVLHRHGGGGDAIRELDDRAIGNGKPGPVTQAMQQAYFALVRGEDAKHRDWLAYV